MDSINIDKIHALKRCKQQELIKSLKFYPLVALICVVVLTSPFWVSSIVSSTKALLFVFMPQILSFFFNAKSLFILGNLIVIFLLKESKVYATNYSSRPREIDVVQGIKEAKKHKCLAVAGELKTEVVEEKKREMEEIKRWEGEKKSENEEEFEDLKENEMADEVITDLSTEELKIRADHFIAMVNKQIRLEADDELLLSGL